MKTIQLVSPDNQPEGLWLVPDHIHMAAEILQNAWVEAEGCLDTMEELLKNLNIERTYTDEVVMVGENPIVGYQLKADTDEDFWPEKHVYSEKVKDILLETHSDENLEVRPVHAGMIKNPMFFDTK